MSKAKKLRGSFRWTAWDPRLLAAQIVALQALQYATLALLAALVQDLTAAPRTLDHIFAYHEIHVRDSEGRALIVAYLLNAGIGAVLMWLLVGRTKLCLDFTCTYYGLHVAACGWYNGGLRGAGAGWWALQAAGAALACVAAELLCLRSELRDIPLHVGAKVDL